MSHHHIQMPIISTPQVKPKKVEPKKRRVSIDGSGAPDGADDVSETFGSSGFGNTAPATPKGPMQNFAPIEGAEQKPQHPRGRLSDSTLKTMLEVQEMQPGLA